MGGTRQGVDQAIATGRRIGARWRGAYDSAELRLERVDLGRQLDETNSSMRFATMAEMVWASSGVRRPEPTSSSKSESARAQSSGVFSGRICHTGAPRREGMTRFAAAMSPSCMAAASAPRTALAARVAESWLAQERAAAEKVGGNFFYPAALQVHCCVKSSHRLIVELARKFLQGCLDLRKSL